MLKSIKCGSFSTADVNEDVCGVFSDCAWVLDGSTGLSGHHHIPQAGSDAQWYAAAFSDFLSETLPHSEQPLPLLFMQGVSKVWHAFHSYSGDIENKYDVPCCLGVAIRLRDGLLEYILIGDCSLLICFNDGTVTELYDSTLSALDENTLRLMRENSAEKAMPLIECRKDILPELRKVRSLMNTKGGYISLANRPSSVLDAKIGAFPLKEVRDVCLLSDGFSQYYRSFGLCSGPNAFMERARRLAPETLYQQLLAAQQADSDLSQHPRFKLSDDSTLVYAEIGNAQAF
ncbi:MAG: hypothetical protein CW335_01920 [Clostridiales bacterium]|nr:hypothetical protein [Clostridiales bacterium]